MMTLKELSEQYTIEELSSDMGGSNTLKYKLFAPFFTQLYENKLIYYEKFFCVADVLDIQITANTLEVHVKPYLKIEGLEFRLLPCPSKPWNFGSQWAGLGIVNNSFHVPYASWRVWPEPELVQKVEECILEGDLRGALKMTLRPF